MGSVLRRAGRGGMLLFAAAAALAARAAPACDVCAVYVGTEMRERRVGPSLGVAEQFTRFTTLQEDGEEVANPAHERLESSITQLVVGWAATPRLALQANVPIVHRSFRRLEGESVRRGSESGPGDVSALVHYSLLSRMTAGGPLHLGLFAGVEFPTGDTDRLREETGAHEEGPTTPEEEHEHAESGVHGHDLAPGSGSFDALAGARLFAARGRFFLAATTQYAVRTEGDFGYEYANELTWSGGPGAFLLVEHDHLLGLQAVLSGETKGKDDLDGAPLHDTAITALYAGPGLLFTWGSSFALEAAGDLPVIQNASRLQIVPDFRIRGGLRWSF